MGEDFERVEFNGLKFIVYMSQYASLVYRHDVDYYLTRNKYVELQHFAPKMFSRLPESRLEHLLTISWPNEVPDQVMQLFSMGRIAIVEGHGGTIPDQSVWGIEIDGRDVPVQELIDAYLADYDTIMFAVCNEDRLPFQRQSGGLIYPHGLFGDRNTPWEMIVAENGTKLCVTPGLSKENPFNWTHPSET
ncbi:MAG: hypothetical protein EPN86_04570 [Nanoarchaeota archaeon]|nr:MAG: hypothetical protein EPN86_04570 [Nanoarchaeota archaeon]